MGKAVKVRAPSTHITDKSTPELALGLAGYPRTPSLNNAVVPFLLIEFTLEKLCFREIILEADLRLYWG